MSTTKQELQDLNKKFEVLITLLTNQAKTAGVPSDPKEAEPLKKKRGRPRKNPVVEKTPAPPIAVEKIVSLYVSPCMQINGVEYGGNVVVPEGIATQLRHMMQKWAMYEQKVTKFIDHGTKDLGVIQ